MVFVSIRQQARSDEEDDTITALGCMNESYTTLRCVLQKASEVLKVSQERLLLKYGGKNVFYLGCDPWGYNSSLAEFNARYNITFDIVVNDADPDWFHYRSSESPSVYLKLQNRNIDKEMMSVLTLFLQQNHSISELDFHNCTFVQGALRPLTELLKDAAHSQICKLNLIGGGYDYRCDDGGDTKFDLTFVLSNPKIERVGIDPSTVIPLSTVSELLSPPHDGEVRPIASRQDERITEIYRTSCIGKIKIRTLKEYV
jgi:hypothetical protein